MITKKERTDNEILYARGISTANKNFVHALSQTKDRSLGEILNYIIDNTRKKYKTAKAKKKK